MGPDYTQAGIHRLFGDNDGDGTVGLSDFLVFRLAF
jgi:hypothetical protein